MIYAGFTACAKPVERGTPQKDSIGPQYKRLQDIGSSTETAVQHDSYVLTHRLPDLRQDFHRRYGMVELAATVVGQHNAIHPELRSRSEEHTSELQSLMRISYAVFCLKKKNKPP